MTDLMGMPVLRRQRIDNLKDVVIKAWIDIIPTIPNARYANYLINYTGGIEGRIRSEGTRIMPAEMREQLYAFIDPWDERSLRIIRGRYGLETGVVETLGDLSKTENVTRERVRQIEKKKMERLQWPSHRMLRTLLLLSWYTPEEKDAYLAQEGVEEYLCKIGEKELAEKGLCPQAIKNVYTSLKELIS